jgi:hypothetical protein
MARDAVIKELGDQHYYWTEAVSALGSMLKFNVQDVIAANSKKLRDRYPNGFIPGGGKREESGNKSYKPSSVQVFLDDLITKLQ